MNSKLIRGVQYAAWAYFFLYLDINLNRFSLLPNAVGWYLLSRAVTALEEEHPDLRLLGPLTFPLGLWALKQYAFLLPAWDLSQFSWLLSWLALAVELTTLYFHFQFLTDLADIAARHAGETGRDFSPALLRARTVVTVLSTAASVLFYLGVDSSGPLSSFSIALTLFLLVVLVVQILCTTVLLFRFSSALRRAGPVLPEGPGVEKPPPCPHMGAGRRFFYAVKGLSSGRYRWRRGRWRRRRSRRMRRRPPGRSAPPSGCSPPAAGR